MDINYVFYKELPILDENIFSANLAENNEIEEISYKKYNRHLITGLKVNQKSKTTKISDELLSNAIDTKNVSFRFVMEMENLFFAAVKFQKKDDVKKQKFIYNNEKGEVKTIEFYDYFDHLKTQF